MSLTTKTKDQFLSDIISTWASILRLSPHLPSGDPLKAAFESLVLGAFLFIQSQVVKVNKLTRAATSEKEDLDSYMADFSFPRLPAIKASGDVKFSVRTVLPSNVQIPPGTRVQTSDGKIQYVVIGDPNKPAWSAALNAYILTAGALSLDATVQAVSAGSASNVQIAALSQMVSSISGISFVTNTASIQNGADPEEDQPYRDRFKLFINAVNKRTTPVGYLSAALNTPGVKAAALVENQDATTGLFRKAYGLVIIDDGSGDPTPELIAAVQQAVAATWAPSRGFGIQIQVIGPVLSLVTIALNVKISPLATSPASIKLKVENAVIDYINSLSIGDPLYLENISYVAKGADPLVVAVQPNSLKINNAEADFLGSNKTVIRTNNTLTSIGDF
jgi:uncharacterized phage protein gp47/JayE